MVAGLSASTCADHSGPLILQPRRSSSVAMPPSRTRSFAISSSSRSVIALCRTVSCLAQRQPRRQLAAATEESHGHHVTRLMPVNDFINVLRVGNLLVIDADNQVAAKINLHVA